MGRWRTVALGMTALLIVGTPGGATARAPVTDLAARVSPNDGGTATKPTKVKVQLSHSASFGPGEDRATSKLVFFFPRQITFSGRAFKACSPSVLNDADPGTQCPLRSKVGFGVATYEVGGFGEFEATLTAYNGPSGKSVVIRVQAGSPANLDLGVEGVLLSARRPFGTKMVTSFPPSLQSASTIPVVLTSFLLTLEGRAKYVIRDGRRVYVPYLGLGRCGGSRLEFKSATTFTTGSSSAADDQLCRP
ncbi:MAG TPA: hypothetical protein VFK52_00435 [Nocardioidaceae bacterium]|nr:hypothetical protein [Nocardioidaceae bacterium]